MHDGGKILGGLGTFLALALFPVWRPAFVTPLPRPQPKIVTTEKTCCDTRETMRCSHMEMLNSWRNAVCRRGERTYQDARGMNVSMSLCGTCMRCHPNKAQFCDSCHNDLAVKPYCWDCHIEPKETS